MMWCKCKKQPIFNVFSPWAVTSDLVHGMDVCREYRVVEIAPSTGTTCMILTIHKGVGHSIIEAGPEFQKEPA